MSTLPNLKTGSAAQYPVRTRQTIRAETLLFLDGAEQRYPLQSRALRSWTLTYARLEEGEMQQIRDFVSEQAASNTAFAFTDPETGVLYPKCRLSEWQLEEQWLSEEAGRVMLQIEEVME